MAQNPTSIKSAFWLGYRDNIAFWLIVAPFGLLFGAVATEAGFTLTQTMIMTSFVVAGSSQFTALTLLQDNAPTLIILATSLAVNLRMAMYSAALVPHLGRAPLGTRALFAYFLVDQSYATSINAYADYPEMTLAQKCQYFTGSFTCLLPVWVLSTYIGALVGAQIPPEYALDFAVPICFIALSAPMMRSLPHFVAAMVSMAGTLVFIGVPYSMGLLIAAFLAMIAGVQVENWLKRRACHG
jgi:predicted branched-subunit amino acid permease